MRLLVTGGGTGGHLFPAIALATAICRQNPESRVLFIGTDRQLENRTLAGLGFERASLRFSGVKGLGISGMARALCLLPPAVLQAFRLLKRFKPELVFAVGGYVTGPVLLAAKLLRVPVCIHEQNSVPGLANRLAGKFADKVCISLPCQPPFAEGKTVLSGNPLREEILAAADRTKQSTSEMMSILVLGGSQGARPLNRLMLAALPFLKGERDRLRLVHQSGTADEEMVRQGYDELGFKAEVGDFFVDMARRYAEADLVISRAGATTLAEIAAMGLPALLIPYPYAADDHQRINGEYYVRGGGAVLRLEGELDGERLGQEIMTLLDDPVRLRSMAKAMRALAMPGATEKIVAICKQLAKE